jgi:hypothetical protein
MSRVTYIEGTLSANNYDRDSGNPIEQRVDRLCVRDAPGDEGEFCDLGDRVKLREIVIGKLQVTSG